MKTNKKKVIGILLIVVCMYTITTGVAILWGTDVKTALLVTTGYMALVSGIGYGVYLCGGSGKENSDDKT